jgi:hypothetical protein
MLTPCTIYRNDDRHARPHLGGGALATAAPGARFLGALKCCGQKFAHL